MTIRLALLSVAVTAGALTVSTWLAAQEKAPKAMDPGGIAAQLATMEVDTNPDTVYETFSRFCQQFFGAEREPLVYGLFGQKLEMVEGGEWKHVSATSACLAWETNLPAKTRVEYGETADYGMTAPEQERFFYVHVHYLRDLKPDTTYHYRLVSRDERGGDVIRSADATFTPRMPAGAVAVPGDLPGPPYVLDKPNTTYVVMKNIVADAGALEVAAEGVTLDLNGHHVSYHNKPVPPETFTDQWVSYDQKGAFGVHDWLKSDLKLLNGSLVQGNGGNAGNGDSTGFNPIYIRGCARLEIAGITVDYRSAHTIGMLLRSLGDDANIHHNVFVDRGTRINSRHATGNRSLGLIGDRGKSCHVHHNLVKRTRQMGLLGADELDHNEVYVDSWSVNSFALAVWKDSGKGHHNRVFGTGVNVQGFGWADRNSRIDHNLIHLIGIHTGKYRGVEGWGDQDSLNGLRVTNYDKGGQQRDDLLYHDNVIVIECTGGSQARGTEFFSDDTIKDLVCRDAVIKVLATDDKTDQVACVVTHGHPAKADTCLPVTYRDCTLISNLCNVRMGDYYGKGSNHHFERCKFVRAGSDPRYHTFIVDGQYWSRRHVMRDCEFGPGTAYNDVLWKLTSNKSFYSIAWTLTVKAEPGAKVTIKDKTGAVEFEGAVGADGSVSAPLTQCVIRPPDKLKCPSTERVEDVKTPHTVAVEKDGKAATKSVEMTKKQELSVGL
jgi:hypothetical protein